MHLRKKEGGLAADGAQGQRCEQAKRHEVKQGRLGRLEGVHDHDGGDEAEDVYEESEERPAWMGQRTKCVPHDA